MIKINQDELRRLHRVFESRMLEKSNGIPFTGFDHPFLMKHEIEYKWAARHLGYTELGFQNWRRSMIGSGRIVEAIKRACRPQATQNLLEQRYGGPTKGFDRARTQASRKDLEEVLYNFFRGGDTTPASFGPRFDTLANHLRERKLGCPWPLMAYLAFLLDPQTYFPIRPTNFERLLRRLSVDVEISGHVTWERYETLLNVAAVLRDWLQPYGRVNAVELQSYMWVLSCLADLRTEEVPLPPHGIDYNSALNRRQRAAAERERIGLAGERFVMEDEIARLRRGDRPDLAEKVRLQAEDSETHTFDILSYGLDETERHIEVKTTVRTRATDGGFYLSESERLHAEGDSQWTIIRVWNIDGQTLMEELGNLIRNPSAKWTFSAGAWFVSPTARNASE
jgi:hypothetical protein